MQQQSSIDLFLSLQVLSDERKLYVTKVSHRSWGLSLHNTDDIIPGAAHLQYSFSTLNLSGVCSSPSPSKPLWLCIYSLHPLIHSKTHEHCLPCGSSLSHFHLIFLFIFFSPLGNDWCVYASVVLLLLDIIVTADVSLC